MIFALAIPAFSQQDCSSAVSIVSLPYSATGLTTTGMLNDYDASDACGSVAMVNEDYVLKFAPAFDMQINIALLNTAIVNSGMIPMANIGLFVTDLCPDDPMANCVASVTNLGSNPSLSSIPLTGGVSYYIIISTANTIIAGSSNVNFDIQITKNAADDVAVTAVEGVTSGCYLTQATIGCYITNNGTNPASAFDVSYTVNGGSQVTQGFPTTLAPLASEYFEFTTPANFPTDGEYVIEVYTNLTGDENTTNDLQAVTVTRYPVYTVFPYTEDFESDNGFFATGGTASSWEYGNPDESLTGLVINTAASGDNCWVTNLEGNTNTNEVSYLETPCFDLSSLFLPTLNINAWVQFSLYGNSANIQASTDGGTTWGVNVYTFAATTSWQNIIVQMPDLAGQSDVKFRINYTSGFFAANGIAIDDFSITEAVLKDLGISEILAPSTGCGLTNHESIAIVITNYGAQTQTNIPVNYSIDGGSTWLATPETANTTIAAGATFYYTFLTTVDFSAYANYDIVAKTMFAGDEDNSNDEYSKTVVSQATITADGYEESFETGPAGWYAYGTASTMELAMPANTLINAAGEGDYAWVTNATGFNNATEVSYLESPCFDFTGMVNPKIKALVQYETTTMISNFSLEYSIDGFTWDTVNAGLASAAWYGTGIIPMGTWSGSSAGWINVSTDVPELAGQSSVKLRFVFNNGVFSMSNTEGVAIDNISIYDCNLVPTAEFTYATNGLDVSFVNSSENGTSYSWNFGDNQFLPSTSTEENPTFTYLTAGSYYVLLTVTNECSSTQYGTFIDVMTDINTINISGLSIFPNPATETITISGLISETIQLLNSNGQIISIETINGNSLFIRDLAAGNYFIKVTSDEKTVIIPFVKN